MIKLMDLLNEGVDDPGIFKCIFLAGGPGSGKSYVANKLLSGTGLKSVNSDDAYEYLAHKHNFDLTDPEAISSDKGQELRNRAKEITKTKEGLYLDGRLGLIIDGTGKNVQKVAETSKQLQKLGYTTMMLFVNTSEEIAQERNQQRNRRLANNIVTMMWQKVQENIMKFQQVFGAANFHVVDNSGGQENPERKQNFDQVFKNVQKFLNSPTRSRQAQSWLADQKPGQDQ